MSAACGFIIARRCAFIRLRVSRREGAGQQYEIALAENLFQRKYLDEIRSFTAPRGGAEHAHAKTGVSDLRRARAHVSHADHAQRMAEELRRCVRMSSCLAPAAGAKLAIHHVEAPRDEQHAGDRMFGDRFGIGPGDVGHRNALRRGGFHGNHVEAHAVARDAAEAGRILEDVGRKERTDEQHVCVGHEALECVGLRVGCDDDIGRLAQSCLGCGIDRGW